MMATANQLWRRSSARERLAVAAGLACLSLVTWWALFGSQAVNVLRSAPDRLADYQSELRQVEFLAAQAQALGLKPGSANVPVQYDSVETLAALQNMNATLLGSTEPVVNSNGTFTVKLSAVNAEQLAAWLQSARRDARLAIQSADLVRDLPRGSARWSGSVVLVIPGNGQP